MKLHEASVTVEVVAAILCMMAEGEHSDTSLPSVLLWLGQRLGEAGQALSDGGQP